MLQGSAALRLRAGRAERAERAGMRGPALRRQVGVAAERSAETAARIEGRRSASTRQIA